jgi:hypothetical protein
VLCVVDNRLFSGSEDCSIRVWDFGQVRLSIYSLKE